MAMPNMFWLLHPLIFYLLVFTGAAQEKPFDSIILQEETADILQILPGNPLPIAVLVRNSDLSQVAISVLKAETWLRHHVLAHFPSTQISTILVGNTYLCQTGQDQNLGLLLPSLKNLHHSLQRWGLEKDIKLSVPFSSDCLNQYPETVLVSLLEFLCHANSTYSFFAPPNFSPLSSLESGSTILASTHQEFMAKSEPFGLKRFNLVFRFLKLRKPTSRQLSFMAEFKFTDPFPADPLTESSPSSSIHSSNGFSHSPQYPPASSPVSLPVDAPPPALSSASPESPPARGLVPSLSPHGPSLPPCNPVHHPAPEPPVVQKLWCVAKPNVPDETLQEAMEYACGEGGADCGAIKPNGACFFPNRIVAHASFAFNSYWQKSKRNGGTCNFGGTAMLINSDPSFHHCWFGLT